jgi:hypothetical protein
MAHMAWWGGGIGGGGGSSDPSHHRQRPLASVVALSVADDGTRRYDQVDASKVIRGTELAPYLPREIWHAPRSPVDADASRRSNVSSSTQSSVKEHTCPVCLDELREGCSVSRFSCSHVLHFECACSWLSSRIRAGNSGTCPLWFAPPPLSLAPCRCWRSASEMPEELPWRVLHEHSIARDTHLAEAADLLCIMTMCSNYVVCAPVFQGPKAASRPRSPATPDNMLQQLLVRICNIRSTAAIAHGSPDNSMHSVASISAPRHSTTSQAEAGSVEPPHAMPGLQERDDTVSSSGSAQTQYPDLDVDSEDSGRFHALTSTLPPLVRV